MESMELLPARVRITAILKKASFSGEYKSGDELSLTDIAAKLGVSRTPVREAFQALEAEGLIELRMNKGAIVKPIDEKYITDHYEMRILLESEAAARAAKNGMPEADKLIEKLLDAQKRINILTCIKKKDAKKARKEMEQHIERSMDNILKNFKFR